MFEGVNRSTRSGILVMGSGPENIRWEISETWWREDIIAHGGVLFIEVIMGMEKG